MSFGKFLFWTFIFFLNRYIFKKRIKVLKKLKQYYKKIIKSPSKTKRKEKFNAWQKHK